MRREIEEEHIMIQRKQHMENRNKAKKQRFEREKCVRERCEAFVDNKETKRESSRKGVIENENRLQT